jgi:hypothetical protein
VATFDDPLWLQDLDYAARLDRGLIEAFGAEGVIYTGAGTPLKVTPRAAGANMSVDVAVGTGTVAGDDQPAQGSYFVRLLSIANAAIGVAPGGGLSRIDLVTVKLRDTDAGSGAGTLIDVVVVAGTPGATPSAPAVPATSLLLAYVTVPNGTSAIQTSNITDKRRLARPSYVLSATQPTDAIGGLIWLKPA